jgi:hypothetical protein
VHLEIRDDDQNVLYSLIENFKRLDAVGAGPSGARLRLGNGICQRNSPNNCHQRPVFGQPLPYDHTLDFTYELVRIDTL